MQADWLNEHLREAFIDFHNGACASDLLANFDPVRYVDTLLKANANRHVSFVKCHHGYAYYPTDVGARHPHLRDDFFGGIAKECEKHGMPLLAYYNVTRDGVAFDENPDWRQTKRDESYVVNRHIKHVCVNSPVVQERIWPMVDEVMDRYPIQGFFFDATVFMPGTCFCEYCKRKMAVEGANSGSDAAVLEFCTRSLCEFMDATTGRIQARIPDAAVYYNAPDFVGKADLTPGQVFLEIESLPSAWGYINTPFYGRYYRSKDIHVAAMTGRFHKSWADFGGIKPDAMLHYEAGVALSLGASLSIGDQGNPDGTLDPAVYEAEGKAFGYYAEHEQWIQGAESVPYVALLARKHIDGKKAAESKPSNFGLTTALIEANIHFDIIDLDAELSKYTAIVMEDVPMPDEGSAQRLQAFVQSGGRLLSLGSCIFMGAGRTVIEDILGVEYAGQSPYSDHYIRTPDGDLGEGLPKTDWVTYGPAVHMRPTKADGVAQMVYPFTEAKPFRAVSHRHGHPGPVSPFPAATIHDYDEGVAAAVACPLGALHYEHAYPPLRILLKNMLQRIVPTDTRVLDVKAPISAEIVLTRQGERRIVHLLNFSTNRRSSQMEIMEEVPPVLDVELRVLMDNDPQRVLLIPGGGELKWVREGAHVVVQVPRFDVHGMVILE